MEGSKTVLLLGTLDTKGAEYAYLRERLRLHGVDTTLADVGVNEPVGVEPDLSREDVAAETGADPAALAAAGDRGAAVTAMAGAAEAPPVELGEQRPLIGASMFGVTTPCVTAAREALEDRGYEVLVFHATGAGGRAMGGLVESGFIQGVLDVTTTELCDDLVGGVLSAGPDRLQAAGRAGLPQVVSLGALDMVNFGARDTVPPQFESRNLYIHNPSVTLMRTTPEECAELGRRIARKLSAATGPTALFLPLRGVSMIDVEGQPFHDPDADAALFDALRDGLDERVELIEMDHNVN